MPPEAPLPATREEIAALIPHQGTMCLLECVTHWTVDSITCTTRSHASASNPLLGDGTLAAVHLCEYAAQAAAVHGGIGRAREGGVPRPGLLVALRDVIFNVPSVARTGTLEVAAMRVNAGEGGSVYTFEVRTGEEILATGRVTVMTPRTK